MTLPKTKFPIESFGPELMEVLKRAGRGEEITIPFPTRSLAKRFQMRLHMLRQRMREESHPEWKIVMRARTSLRADDLSPVGKNKPATVTIYPHDAEFSEALTKAEVKAPSLSSEGLGEPLDEV